MLLSTFPLRKWRNEPKEFDRCLENEIRFKKDLCKEIKHILALSNKVASWMVLLYISLCICFFLWIYCDINVKYMGMLSQFDFFFIKYKKIIGLINFNINLCKYKSNYKYLRIVWCSFLCEFIIIILFLQLCFSLLKKQKLKRFNILIIFILYYILKIIIFL